jgi:signal transduction histidine kinase
MDAVRDSLLLSKINLTYDKNFLKFYVSANCFFNNEQLTYSYFLKGIDKDWRNNQNNPLITYTNLPHGNFILKIKAINSDGIESNVMEMPITITPPFYRTIWFYLAVVILIVSAAYSFYRYRIKQILKLQEVRNKIARDLHDDVGSTLGSINLYSQVAGVKLKNAKTGEIKSILEKIENSSREIIDKTSDAVWSVNPSNDLVKDLIMRIEGYSAALLGTAGIHFDISYDEKVMDEKLSMELRKNLFLIYKEAIHNIIKYAAATEVNILVKRSKNKLMLRITDNGKGFDKNETRAYNGNGLKNIKTRIEEMKGTVIIESVIGKGTTIEVTA